VGASEGPISARLPSELVDLPRRDRLSAETAVISGRLFNKYVAVCKLRKWHPRGTHPALSQARDKLVPNGSRIIPPHFVPARLSSLNCVYKNAPTSASKRTPRSARLDAEGNRSVTKAAV